MDIEKAEELLGKVDTVFMRCVCALMPSTNSKLGTVLGEYAEYIDQALAALQEPKCKTPCSDCQYYMVNGVKCEWTKVEERRCSAYTPIPKPDCQKPAGGEFTKKFRQQIDEMLQKLPTININKTHWTKEERKYFKEFTENLSKWCYEACDRIESQEAELGMLKMGFVPEGSVDIKVLQARLEKYKEAVKYLRNVCKGYYVDDRLQQILGDEKIVEKKDV